MSTQRIVYALAAAAGAVLALPAAAGSPPAPDALTEFAAASWGAGAEGAGMSASVSDDASRVREGAASIRFETNGAFDTWLISPPDHSASWDMLSTGGLAFWLWTENPNVGFQGPSPWVRLYTGPSSYVEYRPTPDFANEARGKWVRVEIPIHGGNGWTPVQVGSPDLGDVSAVEIHADTWEAGFTLWIDGLTFDLPLQPPTGVRAYAGNGRVELSWDPYPPEGGAFTEYRIYRALEPIASTEALTPIGTVGNRLTTAFTDQTAQNGVRYHYAVTAVLAGGRETTEVESVGPRTPRDETDLQIASIARTPRFPRYNPAYTNYTVTEPNGFGPYNFSAATGLAGGQTPETRRWPDPGETVTYTATVRNRGTNHWSGTLTGAWTVDGAPAGTPSRSVSLAPGATTTFELQLPWASWEEPSREIGFEIQVSDDRAWNNRRAMDERSVAFLSFIDRTHEENFREETPGYAGAFSDDLIDWLNRHMDVFNAMFEQAGASKRVHFDVLEVIADGAPDPAVDRIDFAIFPFRYEADGGSLRLSGYYRAAEDIDYGLLHEMGHQLGLIDLYRLDVTPAQNQVNGLGYLSAPGLMHGVSPFLSEHSALAMEDWAAHAHGYYGQYLYATPEHTRLRILGSDGAPLANATVRVYQRIERPGVGDVIPATPKFVGQTDANGEWTLPNVQIDPGLAPPVPTGDELRPNPFGYIAVVGSNGVFLIEVERNGFTDSAWLDITELNNAYRRGETGTAVFEKQVAIGGSVQRFPPRDMAELNAEHWLGWAQDGTIAIADDPVRVRAGAGSIRVETTGGFDNYARYPGGLLAEWDLTGVTTLRLSVFAENPNGAFQEGPRVRILTHDGHVEFSPAGTPLNGAIGAWADLSVPLAGGAGWTRTVLGSGDLSRARGVQIHADTWGAGFTLWLDGVGFDPHPCEADFDSDGAASVNDLLGFLGAFRSGGPAADFDGNGAVNVQDLLGFLGAFRTGC